MRLPPVRAKQRLLRSSIAAINDRSAGADVTLCPLAELRDRGLKIMARPRQAIQHADGRPGICGPVDETVLLKLLEPLGKHSFGETGNGTSEL